MRAFGWRGNDVEQVCSEVEGRLRNFSFMIRLPTQEADVGEAASDVFPNTRFARVGYAEFKNVDKSSNLHSLPRP